MHYNEVLDRLQNLTQVKISQSSIAKVLNVGQSAIGNRATRNSEFSLAELFLIENAYGLPKGSLVDVGNDINTESVTLDFYPNVFGSCGTGLMVFDETSEKIAVTKDVITNYSPHNKYSVISARGSSMSPTINEDDKLIIQHDIYEQIIDDTVSLFQYNGELFIKRLVKNIDQIICISENPRFQDRIIDPEKGNFNIVGKVVGLIRYKV